MGSGLVLSHFVRSCVDEEMLGIAFFHELNCVEAQTRICIDASMRESG
jgi:hypothetical protein